MNDFDDLTNRSVEIRKSIERIDYTSTTNPYNSNTVNTSGWNERKNIDAWQLSSMLASIEKRLDRIEQQLLLIFDQDGPA